jgi:hypothetical protein
MTKLAFQTTKRKDRAKEKGWFQDGLSKINKLVGQHGVPWDWRWGQ